MFVFNTHENFSDIFVVFNITFVVLSFFCRIFQVEFCDKGMKNFSLVQIFLKICGIKLVFLYNELEDRENPNRSLDRI